MGIVAREALSPIFRHPSDRVFATCAIAMDHTLPWTNPSQG